MKEMKKVVGADFADKRQILGNQIVAARHFNSDGTPKTGNRRITAPPPETNAK